MMILNALQESDIMKHPIVRTVEYCCPDMIIALVGLLIAPELSVGIYYGGFGVLTVISFTWNYLIL